MLYTCPSCGYKTRTEREFGSYDICDVCGWEDDHVQLANPVSGGGANTLSLFESQMLFEGNDKKIDKYEKDLVWRKLSIEDIYQDLLKKKKKSLGLIDESLNIKMFTDGIDKGGNIQ